MEMTGEYIIKADQQNVWDALNDPDILKQAIPGCSSIERLNETELEAVATASVGPVKAKFKGKVTLSDLDPPNSYILKGEGKGGAAGFAKGSAHVSLEPVDDATKLTYSVAATVGGKLAQVGQRFIDSTAKKMADEFFKNLSELVEAQDSSEDEKAGQIDMAEIPADETVIAPSAIEMAADTPPETSSSKGLPPLIWIAGLTLVVALLVLLAESMPGR